MKTQQIALLCIGLLAIVSCGNQAEEKAQSLYKLVEHYKDERNYDQAIEVLQRIQIEFENTDTATRAENEIDEYRNLKNILNENNKTELGLKFQRIGRDLETYKTRYFAFPLTASGLDRLPGDFQPDWDDPWGKEIYYKPTYSGPSVPKHLPDGYVLASFGKDGLPGGTDLDQDFFYQDGRMVERITMP